jgi:hypothetical protein
MKKYCFDTSGLSNPWIELPDKIFASVWDQVIERLESGVIGVTKEIYDELQLIPGRLGECIKRHKGQLLMELNDNTWDWESYVKQGTRILADHKNFISEYTVMKSDETVCLKDMTTIALAKAIRTPLVSMEKSAMPSPKKKRIPDICDLENIKHLYFVDFLEAEGIRSR